MSVEGLGIHKEFLAQQYYRYRNLKKLIRKRNPRRRLAGYWGTPPNMTDKDSPDVFFSARG
ncbi:MAG: hypothetical protein WBW53_05865 [Terriglobales bacterium]